MAKHSKKNNIISYDEAKHKKEQEREELLRRTAKHSREDEFDEFEDYDSGYDYDVPKNENIKNPRYSGRKNSSRLSRSRRDFAPDIDDEPEDNQNFEDYSPKYNYREFSNKDADQDDYDDYDNYDDDTEEDTFRRRGGKYTKQSDPLPRNLVNFIIIVAMSIFLIGFTIFFLNQYVVETINIVGNDTIKYHEITTLCGVNYKESMFKVKAEDIIESFESQKPMIEVVEVKKIWPNILEIHVRERPPVCFIVLKGSQKCALIGEGNICLDIRDSYLQGDLPRIYGLDIGDAVIGEKIDEGEIRKLEVLEQIISAMLEANCISELESINITNTTNMTMKSTSGTKIKIGDTTNLVNKFEVVKTAIRRMIAENDTDVTIIVPGDNTFYKDTE